MDFNSNGISREFSPEIIDLTIKKEENKNSISLSSLFNVQLEKLLIVGFCLWVAFQLLTYFFPSLCVILLKVLVTLVVIVLTGFGFYRLKNALSVWSEMEPPEADRTCSPVSQTPRSRLAIFNSPNSVYSQRSPFFETNNLFKAPSSIVPDKAKYKPQNWAASDLWVTIYGFSSSDFPKVYHKALTFCNVVDHVCGSGEVNWIHVQYDFPSIVNAVLEWNNTEIASDVCVKVQRTNMDHLAEVRSKLTHEPRQPSSLRDYDSFAAIFRNDAPESAIRTSFFEHLDRQRVVRGSIIDSAPTEMVTPLQESVPPPAWSF